MEVLPIEREWLDAKMEEAVLRNLQVSDDMGNAIENGNAWHDNAEYDEAIERMKLIDDQIAPFVELVRDAELVDYPDEESETVGLGSVATLDDGSGGYGVILASTALFERHYDDLFSIHPVEGLEEPPMVLSQVSPMGEAVYGSSRGDKVDWKVGEREFTAEIIAVDNAWLKNAATQRAAHPDTPST